MSNIRLARTDDAGQINHIADDLGYQINADDGAQNRFNEILESKLDSIWVYEEGGQIKGWLHLFVTMRVATPKFAEIGGLVVAKKYRCAGIGTELVEQAKRCCAADNLPLRVRCNSSREVANQFYPSIGFEFNKTQRVYQIVP